MYEGLGIFKNEFKKGTISAYVFACVGEDHFVKKVFGAQGADTKGLACISGNRHFSGHSHYFGNFTN